MDAIRWTKRLARLVNELRRAAIPREPTRSAIVARLVDGRPCAAAALLAMDGAAWPSAAERLAAALHSGGRPGYSERLSAALAAAEALARDTDHYYVNTAHFLAGVLETVEPETTTPETKAIPFPGYRARLACGLSSPHLLQACEACEERSGERYWPERLPGPGGRLLRESFLCPECRAKSWFESAAEPAFADLVRREAKRIRKEDLGSLAVALLGLSLHHREAALRRFDPETAAQARTAIRLAATVDQDDVLAAQRRWMDVLGRPVLPPALPERSTRTAQPPRESAASGAAYDGPHSTRLVMRRKPA